jgi:hypothetical protein
MTLPVPQDPAGPTPGPATQAAAMQQAIMMCTSQGWRLQSTGIGTAVMVSGEGATINHVLHAILSLLTCGLWLLVWLLLVAFSANARSKSLLILVDEDGNIAYQEGA